MVHPWRVSLSTESKVTPLGVSCALSIEVDIFERKDPMKGILHLVKCFLYDGWFIYGEYHLQWNQSRPLSGCRSPHLSKWTSLVKLIPLEVSCTSLRASSMEDDSSM